MSTGIKGFRVGAGPRGPYISGGANGLYFRQSLGAKTSRGANTPSSTTAADVGGCFLIFSYLVGLLFIVVGAFSGFIPLLLAGLALIVIPFMVNRSAQGKKLRKGRFESNLLKLSDSPDLAMLSSLAKEADYLTYGLVGDFIERTYQRVLMLAMNNGITTEELDWITRIAATFRIPPSTVRSLQIESYRGLFWELIADHDLSTEEGTVLHQVQTVFRIEDADLVDESRARRELQRASSFQYSIPVIQPDVSLQKSEACHYQSSGALMEKRVMRTFVQNGERIKEEGLSPVRAGRIYITSKRVLVVGDGTSSIPHEKVMDIEIDWDQKLITIVKDGRQKPLFLQLQEPLYAGKLMMRLSDNV